MHCCRFLALVGVEASLANQLPQQQQRQQQQQPLFSHPEAPGAFNGRPDPSIGHSGGVWGSQNLAVEGPQLNREPFFAATDVRRLPKKLPEEFRNVNINGAVGQLYQELPVGTLRSLEVWLCRFGRYPYRGSKENQRDATHSVAGSRRYLLDGGGQSQEKDMTLLETLAPTPEMSISG